MTDLERAKRYVNNHNILTRLIKKEEEINEHLKKAFDEEKTPVITIIIGDTEIFLEDDVAISDVINIAEKEISKYKKELESFKL